MTEQLLRSLQDKYTSGSLRPNDLDNSGLSLIHQAAADGQLTCLKWLIKHGGDPNLRSSDGSVPAHYAAGSGHLPILLYLHERSRQALAAKNNNGATLVYIAAQEGQLDCLIWLTKTASTSPDAQTVNGMTAAHVASQEGKYECLRYLITAAHARVDLRDEYGCTLLHYAAAGGHWKIAKWLMEHCDIGGGEQDMSGATALHVAAKAGREKATQILLKGGVSPDVKDHNDKTALEYALDNDHILCVNLLKEVTSQSLMDLKKKVRFNESVFTYDTSTLPNRKNTFSNRYKRKDRHDYFFDDDFQSQFDHWRSSPKTKRKRERKKKKVLYKGRSEYLVNNIPDKKAKSDETNISLDTPDILKNLNMNTDVVKNSPPEVPVRNGVPILPKRTSSVSLTTHNQQINDATFESKDYSFDSTATEEESSMDTTDVSSITSPRDLPDMPAETSSPRHPPEVPIRQNGINQHVLHQNSLSNDVKFHKTSSRPSKIQYFPPANSSALSRNNSSLSTVSPMLHPQYKSMVKNNKGDRPSYDATNYVPKTFMHKLKPTELKKSKNLRTSKLTNGHGLKDKPSFTNHVWNLDMGVTAQTDTIDYFSNNMLSQHKKASTWSTIRQGFSSFFNSIRQKRMDQTDQLTWPTTKPAQRGDIFSRFSIPNKSRKEFDDLFNSSAEGSYTTYNNKNTINSSFITTPTTESRKLTSLQSGYNAVQLSRFKTRALDNSLKGRSDFVSEIDTTNTSINSYIRRGNVRKPKERVNAIIW